ncbi:ATP-dependent DNA ligase OS=Streptomyces alboniger OX=132473 GN=CP975_30240 PE=4 SV=1 [Streptomyces alboniger]
MAVPLTWEQLDDPAVHARHWTIDNALEQARSDPWAGFPRKGHAPGPARGKLDALRG